MFMLKSEFPLWWYWLDHKGAALMNGIGALFKETRKNSLRWLSATWGYKKTATCKPDSTSSPEPDRTGTLISDFQPPELREINVLPLIRHPIWGSCWQQPKPTKTVIKEGKVSSSINPMVSNTTYWNKEHGRKNGERQQIHLIVKMLHLCCLCDIHFIWFL